MCSKQVNKVHSVNCFNGAVKSNQQSQAGEAAIPTTSTSTTTIIKCECNYRSIVRTIHMCVCEFEFEYVLD